MTETSPRQPDPPSESPLSPAVTTSQTPLTTAQSSSDAKPSTDMSSIDPCIMEQDQSVVLEEHTGGGFDPNGHYRNAYLNISNATDTAKAEAQQPSASDLQDPPAGQNIRRNVKAGSGGGRRPTNQFQQDNDNGDDAHGNATGIIYQEVRCYENPFEKNNRGPGNINDFGSPSASRNLRRNTNRYQQEMRNGRNGRHVQAPLQPDADNSDDDGSENDDYVPRQFQRVPTVGEFSQPRFPVIPNAPVVAGRVVKQTSRRGDRQFIGVDDNEDAAVETSDFQDSNMDDDEDYEQARYHQDESPEYDESMDEDGEYEEDEGEYMVVPEPNSRRPNRVEKNRAGVPYQSNARPIGNAIAHNGAGRSHPAVSRRDKNGGKPRIFFNSPSEELAPSRYSGTIMPWGVNQQPVFVDQDTVSDAQLKKRNLQRPPPGEKVPKRSYGANDPENVAIVNMKENQNMTFAQIADDLNARRVQAGKKPGLTVCGVNGRYNRTAPILFATQGLKFVPLSERKKDAGKAAHGKATRSAGWTREAESRLVDIVKQVEAEKWTTVAQRLNAQLYNGQRVHDASTCAKRYATL